MAIAAKSRDVANKDVALLFTYSIQEISDAVAKM
jgi:hypothetical protein